MAANLRTVVGRLMRVWLIRDGTNATPCVGKTQYREQCTEEGESLCAYPPTAIPIFRAFPSARRKAITGMSSLCRRENKPASLSYRNAIYLA
eukprot:6249134-Pyramimonas_sp.AAC.2